MMNNKIAKFFLDFPFLTEAHEAFEGKTLLERYSFEKYQNPNEYAEHFEVRVSRFSPELMLIAPIEGCFGEASVDGDFDIWYEKEHYYLLDSEGKIIDAVKTSSPHGKMEGERVGDVVKGHQHVAYIVSICSSDHSYSSLLSHSLGSPDRLTVYKR